MGSSTSKPRKGHEHPKQLPKVGTPENLERDHEGRRRQVFGSGFMAILIGAFVVLALPGVIASVH